MMSINLFQAILIGLWTAFCFSGMLLRDLYEQMYCFIIWRRDYFRRPASCWHNGRRLVSGLYGIWCWCWGTVPPSIGPGLFLERWWRLRVQEKLHQKQHLLYLLQLPFTNSICTNFCIYGTCRCARNSYEAFEKSWYEEIQNYVECDDLYLLWLKLALGCRCSVQWILCW